ncbi:hypothetical protein LJCM1130_02580 [Lactobacillus paragasseri]|uniref:Uncharacterized protein n=2 Tax=root TaxID=1 RepID=A0ABQ0N135_9LACO|nr:hypothetical protein [Lactobacillus paragasseri]GBA80286.1 hypothetical protein LJCM1130_02580 [Lactobacillus paragasseri]
MIFCCAEAFIEGYDPTIKLSQKQLLNMVHQIKPNEPLPKEIDCYTVKPCNDYSKRHSIYIYYRLEEDMK